MMTVMWAIRRFGADECAIIDLKDEAPFDFNPFHTKKVDVMMRDIGYFPRAGQGEKIGRARPSCGSKPFGSPFRFRV